MSKIKFESVFCDEIRREDNGKFFLIGVYTDGFVGKLTDTFFLSVWLRMAGLDSGKHDIGIEFEGAGVKEVLPDGELEIIRSDRPASIFLGRLPFAFTEPGVLNVYVRVSGGERVNAGCLYVEEYKDALDLIS